MSRYGPTKQFERIDRICVTRYGSSKEDIVAFVLSVNPGLEKYGIILPPNIFIDLPDRAGEQTAPTNAREQIFLWS